MKIGALFPPQARVTRDIPPVIYFHEQSPAKVKAEVEEYIVTGGYPESHPRGKRYAAGAGGGGIHEQFVRLLRSMVAELDKHGGPELPASWISGFYGSGKSSFAKLVGLALDGLSLPDGTPLEKALLARDDSPQRQDLVGAWEELRKRVNPISVVFDIGGEARDDEHIHSVVLRKVQARLGYCKKSNLVAEHELKLQLDGEWERFLALARQTLGKEWSVAKDEEQAEDHFSHVLHVMNSTRYVDPTSWIDSRAGARTGSGTSVREVVAAIDAMMARWAEGKTLFIVVDEVSQYVHQDEGRMLKLQSFVSELGQKMKGAVWLLATGQQKLEDQAESNDLGKLKDRFPPALRVHLASTNIRDVVHKRLLRKQPDKEAPLRELFRQHRHDMALHAFKCEGVTEEDFVEVYPMLPGHVDLLMQITTALRTRSARAQADAHAIRGLLQLLGELFREQKLAEQDLGALVTLDAIFEVQHSALDADVQTTLARLFNHAEVQSDPDAIRAAKAVALLELIRDDLPTTPELVASCLYARLGDGNRLPAIRAALDKLRALNLLSYSEKTGFRIQSSAGQEWERERHDKQVSMETINEIVQQALKSLVGALQERPKYKGRAFPWTLWFSDGRHAHDVKLMDTREDSTVAVDFRYLKDDRESAAWVQRTGQEKGPLWNRIVWVVGDAGVEAAARECGRSHKMIEVYQPRRASIGTAKQQLLLDEETRYGELEADVAKAVAAAFQQGAIYFRGQPLRPQDLSKVFGTTLLTIANRELPNLYPWATDLIAISDVELAQLFAPDLRGPSTKFLDGPGGLGILSMDGQRYMPTCQGEHPRRIFEEIEKTGGLSGQSLIATFVGPPYGYPADLVRACVAGLLRAKKIRIRMETGDNIASYGDAGVKDVFTKDRAFRKAEVFPRGEDAISPRDRVAIGKFFETYLDAQLDREDEVFADAAFRHFPRQRELLTELERLHNELPGSPALPDRLTKLGKALVDCCRQRPIEDIVRELKRNLDVLRDGMEQLKMLHGELTKPVVAGVVRAARVRDYELAQLEEAGEPGGLEDAGRTIREHLGTPSPWRGLHLLDDPLRRVVERYREVRGRILNQQAAAAEQAQARIKTISGFEQLGPDEAHRVLKPILDARVDTTAEAVFPSLVAVRDGFASRIGPAEEQARDRLDEERNRSAPTKVVKVQVDIRGREVATREELRAVFREVEERVGPLLDRGDKVRIW